ncbi:MAG: hemolysin family protein [Acidobacteriota bacterium]|nr:hemolysin family protein [Acidobacteriota bacterium]
MTPLLLFLLGCAAVYLGTVTAAFNALMRLSLRINAERTDRDDKLGKYLEDPRRLFVPARILSSIIIVVGTALMSRVTGVDRAGFPMLVLSLIGVVLAWEQLLPLLIVRHNPEHILDVLLPSFDALARLLRPLTSALLRIGTRRRERAANGGNGHDQPPPAEAATPAAPEAEAAQEGQARELLRSLVDFRETMVREVMTPRPDIIGIEAGATFAQLQSLFREQQYSRVPAYKETLDNVLGFVFVKDLILLKPETSPNEPITPLIRPAHFVPETKRVPELLKEFQRKRVQIAVVVDEYGGTAGLVTVEDLVEEIVGEIRDEYDVEVERIVDEGYGSFVFSGSAHVEEMANLLKLNIEGKGFETVGGFLLSQMGRVPAVGEKIELDDIHVEILETQRRRITRVRISRREPAPAAEPAR